MSQNEIIQVSIVCLIVLAAILWSAVRIAHMGKKKSGDGCSCCSSANDCKAKELREEIRHRGNAKDCRRKSGNYRDGQSAKNL